MITNKHPVFGHRLEGLFIHVDGEWDSILLCASHHRYLEIIGIEVAHMRNGRLRLVKGAPAVDDLLSTHWIRGNHACRGMDPLLRRKIHAQQHLVRQPFPSRLGVYRLVWEHRSNDYPDGASSPISSTFEGPPIGIPPFRGAQASLGAPSKTD